MQGIVSSDNQGASGYAANAVVRNGSGPGQGMSQTDVFGAILEGRIIMVATGDVVGMFTLKEIHPHPEAWSGTDAKGQSVRISSEDLNDSDIEYLRTNITQKLIDFLKGLPVPDSVVSSSGYGTAYGGKTYSGAKK